MLRRYLLKSSIFLLAFVFFTAPAHSKTPPALTSDDHLSRQLPRVVPMGWELSGDVKRFSPENLWRQINGRADFFLSCGMLQMTLALYAVPSDPETFIEVSIFNMGNPTYAFGAFSTEQPEDLEPIDLGRRGYRSGTNLFFWKGAYYVRMIASDDDPDLQKINMRLAKRIMDLLDDSGESVWGLETLPKADRIPGSEQYFRKDAMGLDFMRNTYLAKYRKKGAVITLFLSPHESAAAAVTVFHQYMAYAKQFGEGIREIRRDGVALMLCDMSGSYDAFFQKDAVVSGVTAVEDREQALDAAFDIWRHLQFSKPPQK